MMEKKYFADLHMHTIYSDGSSRPSQQVIDSALLGMDVMAITDHDSIDGYLEAKEESKNWGIKVLPGVEISTTKYHILGYCFDAKNPKLLDLLQDIRQQQFEIASMRIDILHGLGVPISVEKVLTYSSCSRVGKGNIISSMLRDPECRAYNGAGGFDELYRRYFSKGTPAGSLSFKNPTFSKDAIDTIHAAGGIAVVAHPFKEASDVSELDSLIREGIDGLEIQPNYGKKNIPFMEYALKHDLLITYGSDNHGSRHLDRPLLKRLENKVFPFWEYKIK
jgi:predicted metal-dependent phosphoesterase TrpH